ncbi:hypothetical protein HY642_02435 [Candidatus Woesearchaeota archaeon]|nr:hypothetical protein [Candidatus Woesearchaeota archaeon]
MTKLQYPLGPPDWQQYLNLRYDDGIAQLRQSTAGRKDIVWSAYGVAQYNMPWGLHTYFFYRLMSREFGILPRSAAISGTIHANEQAGFCTLVEQAADIFTKAHDQRTAVIMYPCLNPAGFDLRTINPDQRYNPDGERPNNDFIHYQVKKLMPDGNFARMPDGAIEHEWVDDLKTRKDYVQWQWADRSGLKKKLPLETRLALNDIRSLPKQTLCGVVDLHQDWWPEYWGRQVAYAYPLGNPALYVPAAKRIETIVPLLKHEPIVSGYADTDKASAPVSDEYGNTYRHDGSLADAGYRCGAVFAVEAESSRDVPMSLAKQVNRIWIDDCLDWVAKM